MNLQWKYGQLKLPNGQNRKLVSGVKTCSFQTSCVELDYWINSRVAYQFSYSIIEAVLVCKIKFKFLECVLHYHVEFGRVLG